MVGVLSATRSSTAVAASACPCHPDPADLPVALLSATVDDATVDPALMALTVDYEARRWRAEALARHLLDWVLDYACATTNGLNCPRSGDRDRSEGRASHLRQRR